MNDACVCLENLRITTDGNIELELELFEEFISSSASLIEKLLQSLPDDESDNWRTHAHTLKGISINLGAKNLSNLAKTAQELHENDKPIKTALLKKIQEEHKNVLAFLKTVHR